MFQTRWEKREPNQGSHAESRVAPEPSVFTTASTLQIDDKVDSAAPPADNRPAWIKFCAFSLVAIAQLYLLILCESGF